MSVIRAILLALSATGLTACSARYTVDLWNDTGQPMQVRIIESSDSGSEEVFREPRAVIAPGGWFDFRVQHGDKPDRRRVEISPPDADSPRAAADIGNTGVVRARIILRGDSLILEPITPTQSAARRKQAQTRRSN